MRRLVLLLLVLLAAVSCGSPSDVVNSPTAPSVVATAAQQPGDAVSSPYKKPGTVESPVYIVITNLWTRPMEAAAVSLDYAPYDRTAQCEIFTWVDAYGLDISPDNPLPPGETRTTNRVKCLAGKTYALVDVGVSFHNYWVGGSGNSLIKPVVDGSSFVLDDAQGVPVARVTFYVRRPR